MFLREKTEYEGLRLEVTCPLKVLEYKVVRDRARVRAG